LNDLMKGPEHGSTRPYLIRALYEWCTDNGLTPYVAVQVDDSVQVPREFVKNNEIVLNISFDATSSLKLGNEFIEFKARFGGVAREIIVPIERVIAIYARENGQGMAFPAAPPSTSAGPAQLLAEPATGMALALANPPAPSEGKLSTIGPEAGRSGDQPPPQPPKPGPGRPSLKRIK
jgi:stringent starvation protein B